ncbi:basic-leucine zipper transcription factor family protein [Striga asiatica]|uniref:Basic-leucine zipper transcription factor family protein n=1 Tax=Striga asiatica TaxID=4170 RepID=A0A5A7P3J2_STRAF|nr:basic-leucine zipper transcription factor family protein [Striga asiatica]
MAVTGRWELDLSGTDSGGSSTDGVCQRGSEETNGGPTFEWQWPMVHLARRKASTTGGGDLTSTSKTKSSSYVDNHCHWSLSLFDEPSEPLPLESRVTVYLIPSPWSNSVVARASAAGSQHIEFPPLGRRQLR